MRSRLEKLRIPLSRIAALLGVLVICSANSYWETRDEVVSFLLFAVGVTLVAIASLGRMWCSLYIAGYKDKKLITSGPYSLCRNPLYFFSLIGVVGVGFSSETVSFPVIFLVLFSLYYPFVIRGEESRLEEYFGAAYEDYKSRVPAFFPRLSSFQEPAQFTVNPGVYRRHMFSALWFVWIVGILEFMEGLREIGVLGHLWVVY